MPRDVPPLLVVELLFRAKSDVADLSHVITSVSQFLDSSVELPLHRACGLESVQLLERLWASSKAFNQGNSTHINTNGWSLRGYLRGDRYYRQYQFNRSLQEAVKRKHVESVKWLSANFQGYPIVPQVVTAAASVGILQFFRDNDNISLKKQLQSSNPNKRVVVGHRVHWSRDALEAAVLHGHNNVMWWLLQHIPDVRYDKNKALQYAVKNGDIALAEWLLSHGANWVLTPGRNLVHEVAAQGRVDVLKWLEKHDLVRSTGAGVLLMAAENGHLEVVRWLLDIDAARSDNEVRLTNLGGEASLAIHIAAVNGHLEVAKYLRARAKTPLNAYQHAVESEGQVSRIRLLNTRFGESCKAAKVSVDTLTEAGKKDHAQVVQWLWMEYVYDPKVSALSTSRHQQTQADGTPLDAIAARGRLRVLKMMHTVGAALTADSRKRNRDGSSKGGHVCTSKAMDGAASNGHLDVVKWLHETREEGCTSRAMDGAASGGHLRVVQWLHENTTKGYTTAAMDGAATNGHLDVVKWLHVNMNAGCTTDAMDEAAANGHLDVVKWLHEHRSEGCTAAAMDGAAEHGHLAVVQWLHRNRAEGCTTAAMDQAALQGHFDVVQWLQTHRSDVQALLSTVRWIMEISSCCCFYTHNANKFAPRRPWSWQLVTRKREFMIYAWILDHYPQFRTPLQE